MFKDNKNKLNLTLIALLAAAMFSGVSCSSGASPEEEPATPEEKAEKRFAFLKKRDQAHSKSYETIDAERVIFKADSPVKLSAEELKKLESPIIAKRSGEEKKSDAKVKHMPRFYDDFIALNGDEEVDVSLIFNSAPLLDVLSAFADVLGFNFVGDGLRDALDPKARR